MSITSIQRDTNNNVSLVRIITTDTLTTIQQNKYVSTQMPIILALNNGKWDWYLSDMVLVSASDGNAFFYFVDPTFATWTIYNGLSSGTVNPGTKNQIAYYASTGSTVSGFTISNTNVLATDNTGALISVPYTSNTGFSANSNNLVYRDGNGSFSITNIAYKEDFNNVPGTITLTASSSRLQRFAGTGSGTCVMPDATTLPIDTFYQMNNIATGSITVQRNGGGTIVTIPAGGYLYIRVINVSTSGGSWEYYWGIPSNGVTGQYLSPDNNSVPSWQYGVSTAGTPPGGTTNIMGRDSNGNTSVNNITYNIQFRNALGSDINLSAASAKLQEFTSGSVATNILMPDATTLVVSWPYKINNGSTANVFVKDHGGSNICTLLPGGWVIVRLIDNTTVGGQWEYSAYVNMSAGGANRILMSTSDSMNFWSTATYPITISINQLLYSSANNVISGLATANNAYLVTNGSGVPSWSTTLPTPTTFTTGSIIFASGGSFAQDNANLFWDGTNHQLGVGTNSLQTTDLATFTSTKSHNTRFNGTQTAVDSNTHQHGIYYTGTFNPTSGSSLSSAFEANGIWFAPTAQTISIGSGFHSSPSFIGNQGTITNYYGFYFDGGFGSGTGTITNNYGAYFVTPLDGTNKIPLYADAASIGYTATVPPTNGAFIKGQVGIGTSSIASSDKITSTSTSGNNVVLNGTQTAVDSNTSQSAVNINGTLNPTNGSVISAGISITPKIISPSTKTISNAIGVYLSPDCNSNVGTIGNFFGIYFDGGGAPGAGTVTNSFGSVWKAPTFGTNKIALAADNITIGTSQTVPPSNGLYVQGNIQNNTLTASQVVVTDGSKNLTSAAYSSVGSWQLIQTQTVSSVITVNFTNNTMQNFKILKVLFNNVKVSTTSTNLTMLASSNGGSTYLNTGYFSCFNNVPYNSTTVTNDSSTTLFNITGGFVSTNDVANGEITIFNFNIANNSILSDAVIYLPSSPGSFRSTGFGTQTAAFNAFQFTLGGINIIASGTFSVYGIAQ